MSSVSLALAGRFFLPLSQVEASCNCLSKKKKKKKRAVAKVPGRDGFAGAVPLL